MSTKTQFHWHEAWFSSGAMALFAALLLSAIGLLFIDSASYRPQLQEEVPYASKQAVWLLLSLISVLSILPANYTYLIRGAYALYLLGILSLIATALFGILRGGAKSWIQLGPVCFQTSEFMKLGLILALAKWLSDHPKLSSLLHLAPAFAIALFPMVIILKQPDLGSAMIFVPILFVMLYVAGARSRHLALIVFAGLIAAPLAYTFTLKEYQQKRIQTFFQQNQLSSEQKQGDAYHLEKSKTAIGDGGIKGRGFKQGTLNRKGYLPANHTDFIFAVIGEEWGLIGTLSILFLYFCLFFFLGLSAYTTHDLAGRLVIIGIAAMLSAQVLINTSMTVGLAPITGLPLPFLSYGGSALLFSFLGLALVMSIKGRKIPSLSHATKTTGFLERTN